MKRFLTVFAACMAVVSVYSCRNASKIENLDGPSVEWPSNPDFATVEITDDLDATIRVNAPAGIKTFVVTVDSDELEAALKLIGLEKPELDLINDSKVIEILSAVTEGALPTGNALLGQTSVDFNISSLVKLILPIAGAGTEHSFKLDVSDNNAKSVSETCIFRVPASAADAPSVSWEGNESFAPVEIEKEMNVKIKICAPAGFKTLVVKIESAVLNAIGISEIDMVNPGEMSQVVDMILGGQNIGEATELNLDLSSLVPLILSLNPEKDTDHIFTLSLSDKLDRSLEKACVFHYSGPTSPDLALSDVDLWANTATVNIEDATSVEYRVKGSDEWIPAENKDGAIRILPVWEESVNPAGLTVYTVKEGTGIFAGNTYEFRIDGQDFSGLIDYTAEKGDIIPNGDMSGWSKKDWKDYSGKVFKLTYPNQTGDSFWDSGNNSLLEQYDENGNPKLFTPLCSEDKENSGVAILQSQFVLGSIFAPGNMFVGDFDFSGFSGTAKFGKPYAWTARPVSLKVRYKAEVGKIDRPEGSEFEGQQDKSRIFAAVVDWSAQHGVTSGLGASQGIWDPCTEMSQEEGKILGYASLEIDSSSSDFITVEIPFEWYETSSKPGSGNISLVISCATSIKGDSLIGCSTNKLRVDDFEWVY